MIQFNFDFDSINFSRALIIDLPWIYKILEGEKTWEMRSNNISIRGRIGLIQKGTGLIVGSAILIDSLKKIDLSFSDQTKKFHCIDYSSGEFDKWVFPWVLTDVTRFNNPIPYDHPRGAVVWVQV